MVSIRIFIILGIIFLSMNQCKRFNNWSAEEFLTGKFLNNLGSYCILFAKDGKLTGEYYTKPSRGELIQPSFPIYGIYTPVKDGALVSMIVTFKMEGESNYENYSQVTINGKVYSAKNDFKMNWLLNRNEKEENEWSATNIGQDHFVKIK